MSDLPSSFGIEAVELVADGGRSVTVRGNGSTAHSAAKSRAPDTSIRADAYARMTDFA